MVARRGETGNVDGSDDNADDDNVRTIQPGGGLMARLLAENARLDGTSSCSDRSPVMKSMLLVRVLVKVMMV